MRRVVRASGRRGGVDALTSDRRWRRGVHAAPVLGRQTQARQALDLAQQIALGAVANEIACPAWPARAVRPIR